MGSDWTEVKLEDVCEDITVGFVGSMSSLFTDDGVPLLRGQNIEPGRLNIENLKYISRETHKKWSKSALNAGDVVIVRVGMPGVSCVIPKGAGDLNAASLVIVRPNKSKLNSYFLSYVLNSELGRRLVQGRLVGSVQQVFNAGTAASLPINLPSLPEQERIAGILGALDDKIELNRKMNETLEQMAKALFKSWFVDFDPVHAKAAGRQPAGMDKATADLFPDSFVDSELGMIPKGWEVALLGDELSITRGCSYKSEELSSSTTAMVTLKSFKRGGGYRQDGLKPYIGKYKPNQVVRPGDLVVSYTDVTQAAELIGRPAIIGSTENFENLVISQDVSVVRANDGIPTSYLYGLMMEESFRAHTYAHSTGTTVLHLSSTALPSYKFVKPNPEVLLAFDRITSNLMKLSDENEKQSRKLTAMRDTLLPRLLSGEMTK